MNEFIISNIPKIGMNIYKIELQDLLSKVIEIEAPSAEEDIDKFRGMYKVLSKLDT